MNPIGQQSANLDTYQTSFYVEPSKVVNDYETVTAVTPTLDTLRFGYGEMYTPSGNALVSVNYFIYPLGGPQGVYTYVAFDGVNYGLGYSYLNGIGWTQIIRAAHIFTGLDPFKKHTFQWKITRTGYSAYVYHGPTYESHFWGKDFPAKMFAGPPSQTIP